MFFSIKQLIKLWKKTFLTIDQLSFFVGHPVCINKTLQENMYMYIPICTLGVICYIQKYKILILSIFL